MMDGRQTLIGLRRGVAVLRELAGAPQGRSFSDLRRRCEGLAPPTLSRLLKALLEEGLIEKRPGSGCYAVGPTVFGLARAVLGLVSAADVVQPVLDRLAEATGQSSAYFERSGGAMVLVAKREHPESWHYMPVGGTHPKMTRNGFGQLLLAYMEPRALSLFLARTSEPLPLGREAFAARLARIRGQGLFVEKADAAPSLWRIVAPVLLADGQTPAGAVGITFVKGSLSKPGMDAARRAVRSAAAEATRGMAGSGRMPGAGSG
ncbi:MAG: helix-turn-helix domain-containing protein [Kiritimatiellae bacterium]|nr:helix-turn-helix domain-containing protein [Kiritimatiellia bacterium]